MHKPPLLLLILTVLSKIKGRMLSSFFGGEVHLWKNKTEPSSIGKKLKLNKNKFKMSYPWVILQE